MLAFVSGVVEKVGQCATVALVGGLVDVAAQVLVERASERQHVSEAEVLGRFRDPVRKAERIERLPFRKPLLEEALERGETGVLVGQIASKIVTTPLEDVIGKTKGLDMEMVRLAKMLD